MGSVLAGTTKMSYYPDPRPAAEVPLRSVRMLPTVRASSDSSLNIRRRISSALPDVERFSRSLRGNRVSGLWSLPGTLTSHLVLHFLRFSDRFRGESRQI